MNLFDICTKSLQLKGLENDIRYTKRLKWEIEEVNAKEKHNYFLNLYTKRIKYPANENNLLICWLLGIVPDYNILQDPHCEYGEYPDIDTDYIPVVRDYLKNIWAPNTFGTDYVCNIGNYTTFGLKNSLLDMARVHSESRDEIQVLTKSLDSKDDEGKVLTWDAAMKLYPDLKKYCDEHKDVADAARRLLHRNRGMGVHAGGLIIANAPLHDLVPLVKRKDNPQASAWVEGLHGQDLQPVGLVKFDLLVISNLLQIARCCEMVKKRYKLEGIFAKPGEPDWTDVPAWRSDKRALAMANAGDTKCIFQFDSEGIRGLVRAGGVDCFEDLVAYSALFRPGPLGMKMTERYVERKRGREKFTLHPLVKSILEKTYGVLTYQEQIMRILNVVGEIPLKDCELVRKAISKKNIQGFIKYKEMFIINGQKNLGLSEIEITHLWNQIEAFAEYGFNLSHAVAYTYISQWLLCLKSHWPHEFYASMLSCETTSEKIKDYKMEAKIHGVDMHRLDINKSGINFELHNDMLYFGMSNVKGIGEAPAKRIIQHQPYKSFEDFLMRFGTDASVLKPLLGLRCFRDRDPITLWKFTECFKDASKKMDEKKKRYKAAMIRYEKEFKDLLPHEVRKLSDLEGDNPFDSEGWRSLYDKDEEIESKKEVECPSTEGEPRWVFEDIPVSRATSDEEEDVFIERESLKYFKTIKVKKTWNRWIELRKIWQKRKRTLDRHKKTERDSLPNLLTFDINAWDIDNELLKELRDPVKCEEKYYGFAWIHELEKSPDYKGNLTFDVLKNSIDNQAGPVELLIKKATKNLSKKGKDYYQLVAEDVTGQENKINVWPDDWAWWGKELSAGNLLRLRLQPPSGGFNTFLLDSNQVGKWRGKKRYENKEDDIRVIPMRKGQKEEEKFLSDEEAMDQFSNCIMGE